MPTYEMPILLRVMTRPETVSSLKRVASVIFGHGGFIRKIDNLGEKRLPSKARAHGHVQDHASYFILHFDVPPRSLSDMEEEYGRDMDIIRTRIYKNIKEEPISCTFHEEMLPPAYRPSVQKLVALAQKQDKNKSKFKPNTGLTYYPFQR